jgi:hypothetical protein
VHVKNDKLILGDSSLELCLAVVVISISSPYGISQPPSHEHEAGPRGSSKLEIEIDVLRDNGNHFV